MLNHHRSGISTLENFYQLEVGRASSSRARSEPELSVSSRAELELYRSVVRASIEPMYLSQK